MSENNDLIARLLEAERQRVELPSEGVDSLWRGTATRVASGAVPAAGLLTPALLKLLGVALLAFGVGVLAGRASVDEPQIAALSAALPQVASLANHVDVAPAEPEIKPAPPTPAQPAPAAAPSVAKSSVAAAAPSSAPVVEPPAKSTLPDERVLVEGARTALLRSRPTDALNLARKHQARFPHGELAEDRDFIIASALSDLGRSNEAKASAKDFVERYPKSSLRAAVEPLTRP